MIAAEPYMLVFRVLHVVGGVLWVGSTFLFSAFIGRAAAAIGPAAGPMLHQLVVEEKVTKAITGISVVTVAAGGFVYWHDLQIAGSLGDFLDTDFGLALTIGAVLGIIAMFWGYFQVGVKVEQMVAFAGSCTDGRGPTASGGHGGARSPWRPAAEERHHRPAAAVGRRDRDVDGSLLVGGGQPPDSASRFRFRSDVI